MAPNVETLEVRLVPTVISGFASGTLQINADNADNITVTVDGSNRVLVNGSIVDNGGTPLLAIDTQLAVLDVRATGNFSNVINLSGVTINAVQHPLIVQVNSGGGADTITGSEFADRLEGGGGLNVLRGGDGNDILTNGFDSDGQAGDDLIVINTPLNTLSTTDISLRAEMIRLGADLRTAGGTISLFGNVMLTNDVIIATGSGSGGDVQINGTIDSGYTLVTTPRSYADAKAQAPLDVPGGYLVTIRSQAEQDAVQAIVGGNDVWIAASDAVSEGRWEWDAGPDDGAQFWEGDSTGTAVNFEYSNWASGEPNDPGNVENAAQLIGSDPANPGRWSDQDASLAFPYVVESQFSLTLNAGTATVNLNGPVGNISPLRSLSVVAGLTQVTGGAISTFKSQTFATALLLTGPMLLRAEEVNFNGVAGSVTGSGTSMLTLAPIRRDSAINVGAASETPGDASFDITDLDITKLGVGFAAILIGEPPPPLGSGDGQGFQVQSTGPVTITGATFSNSVSIAGGSISVFGLDAGTNKVELIAGNGSITDGGGTIPDIRAGDLLLDSSSGIGDLTNAIETSASAISARASNSGGVFLDNSGSGELAIGAAGAPGGIFTNNGVISVSTTGAMLVNQSIVSNGGNINLTATNGISINGAPVDTAASDGMGGQFTADADSNNDGSGTFAITSFMEFVDYLSPVQGVFADGEIVLISTSTLASAAAVSGTNDTRFSDSNIYSPNQAAGDFVETHFSAPNEFVTFAFSKPRFGLFLHFDGMQYQGLPFPGISPALDLYSFDSTPERVSGDPDWDVNGNAIRQVNGNEAQDLDGTVRFTEGLSSLTLTRTADGVSPGADSIVNLQLGLFRAGGVKTGDNAISIRAADVNLDGFLDAGTDLVTLIPSGTNRPIDLGTETAGSLSLTDAELDRLMAGTLQVGDASSGVITVSDNITRPTATDITLTTGGDNNINFDGTNATLDSNNGNVTLLLNSTGSGAVTSGDALKDVRGINVVLTSGSGGLGTSGNPLITDASTLVVTTKGNASAFLEEIDSVTIASLGLSAGSGVITLTGGTFRLGGSNRIDDSSQLVVGAGAKFQLNGSDEALVSLTGSGSVINGSATAATLSVNLAGDEVFGGVLGGAGTDENNFGFSKSGSGALTLSGTNTYSGDTVVNDGKLLINGSIQSNVAVKTGAVVGGSGEIDSTHALVVENGATLAPGNSAGLLNVGTLSLQSGSSFDVELNGTTAGTDYDQVHVTGTGAPKGLVTIATNVTLTPTLGFTAAPGDTFVIIDNDGSDAVSGTFKDLTQGALLTISGKKFHIVYDFNNGDGNKNDVALIFNRPPMVDNQSFSINENNGSGAGVGTVIASDAESAVTYAITGGNTDNVFAIGSTSGQITVNNATGLNFESNPTFSLTVRVTDDAGATDTATIAVAVTNAAPGQPTDTNVAADSVSEAAINGDQVGITASSADVHGGTVLFRLTDDASGRFSIESDTGIVRVADASLLDFESVTSHRITIQASDNDRVTTQDFTITVTNVAPSAPVDTDPDANAISEGVGTGDSVGITAFSSDVHGGSATFSLADDADGRYTIGSTTGIVTIADVTLLNFAVSTSHSIIVQASDGRDVTSSSFTINVNGAAPPLPEDLDNHADTVPEGALEGSRVGITLYAKDAQGEDVFYRLKDNAGGRFAIDPLTGVVTVKEGRLLQFADAKYTIRAVAVDASAHFSLETSFSVTVTQVPADALPLASILPTRVSVVEGDSGPNFITFLVKLNKPSAETITIDFSTRLGDDPTFQRPEGIGDNTAFATDQPGPWDFFRSSGTLTFDPGVTEQPLRVQIRPDDRPEANELFFVQLQLPVNDKKVKLAPQQSVAIAQILDDDSVPQLIVANTQVLEGDSDGQNEMVFTVQLIGDLPPGTASVTADYFIGNIAVDTAIAGDDYGIAYESEFDGQMPTFTNQLTFTNDLRTREVHVPIMGDTDPEADKTVSLRLQNHDDPETLGLSRQQVVGTIIDDDSTTNVLVSISPAVYKIRENHSGSQQAEFTVTLIGKPSGTVSVNYAAADATADATATAGSDFEAASGTIEFTLADILAGVVQKSFPVTVFGDKAIEPDEIFTVALSLPPGTPSEVSIDPDLATGKVVIRNDDQAILTEDGDALALALSNELTALLGAGPKNNPALLAALRSKAVQIIQNQGLTKAIVIIIDPVDFVLTDPDGRQSGYTETAGSVNQIPGTYYSGDGAVELLIVPLPPDGTYNVQLAGLGGDFNASITVVDSNGTTTNIVSQNLSDGATSSVSFQVGNTSSMIPVGLGLAAANAAASAIGVVGDFGHGELGLALASALEQAISDEFDLDESDSRATGLMYWLSVSARVLRQQVIEPLWQTLGTPLDGLFDEGRLARITIPSELVDQFWSQVGQTLTGVPSGIYRLGNMLESVIPTLVPRRVRSALPRSGDQRQPNPAPGNNGVKPRRSSLERPRVAPPNGQVQPPSKPNATKDKSAQTPDSRKMDGQQSSTSHTRWLWFPFKDEKSAAKPTERRGA